MIQESVREGVRGTVGGVQSGLNSAMDTIKYILVIALPDDDTFGYLVLASFGFIVLGLIAFTVYALQYWDGPKLYDDERRIIVEDDKEDGVVNYGATERD